MSKRQHQDRSSRSPDRGRRSPALAWIAALVIVGWLLIDVLRFVVDLTHQALVVILAALVAFLVVRVARGRRP
jgi:Flp pilus assembly protein TadB